MIFVIYCNIFFCIMMSVCLFLSFLLSVAMLLLAVVNHGLTISGSDPVIACDPGSAINQLRRSQGTGSEHVWNLDPKDKGNGLRIRNIVLQIHTYDIIRWEFRVYMHPWFQKQKQTNLALIDTHINLKKIFSFSKSYIILHFHEFKCIII